MKKVMQSMLLLLLTAGTFLAGSWYGQRVPVTFATASQAEVVHRVDATHPAHTSHTPGNAQASGMPTDPVHVHAGMAKPGGSLVPVSSGSVQVNPETQQLLGVQVSPVEKTAVTLPLRLLGRVAPDEARVYRLNAGIEGFIRDVFAPTTGSQVKRGQPLATFSAPNALSIMQLYLLNTGAVDRLSQDLIRESGRNGAALASANIQQRIDQLENLGMSAQQIEEIKRTREIPDRIRIVAPADGFVLARNVSPGQKFDRGAEWYQIADLSRVWILADVFENEAQYLRPGLTVTASLPQQKRTFHARVSAIRPQFDPATRTLKVRLEAENPDDILRPDMFVDVELPIRLPPTIAVSADAVLDSGVKQTVFVERGEGLFEPRQVETGWRFGDRVEIVKGLRPGERIVTAGTFLLDSESRMRSAPPGGTGHRHAAHAHQAEGPTGPASAPRSATRTQQGHMHSPATEMTSEMAPVAQASANAEEPAHSAVTAPHAGEGHGWHDQPGHDPGPHAAAVHAHAGHQHP